MSFNNPPLFSSEERQRLREIAHDSIRHGLERGEPLPIELDSYPPLIQRIGANFVTLTWENQLRGCVGTLDAYRPLVLDVAENAYASAFRDPRFPSLTADEFERLTITVSILTPPLLMTFENEQDLIFQLRPGVDGLVLEEGMLRGTFLPAVWEILPDPRLFLKELKRKIGLPPEHWSNSLRVLRYTVEKI
ncbi:AMMECR1 domain protein [Nitrosococcus halophilus Nc 4]|uniref:AMMECR1 domain protein n=1 Tax=Nitrosococcus halophilus (strain Nc4) TaxID=472759 RepID=D5C239_NITHN|nr:AmmeMemoRadiSam system protein A [Nitrosococcus halophilus]ADE16627.1 AMMECR1 domain protein [Nitrosococcus halophilus Nc 4]